MILFHLYTFLCLLSFRQHCTDPFASTRLDIAIEAYAPTAPLNKFPGGPLDPVLNTLAVSLALRSANPSSAIAPSQILLRFISQLGAVAVTTSGKEWRMREQLEAGAAVPLLDESEMEQIASVGAQKYARVYMPHMEQQ